jgi:hypothetical protein
MRNKLVAKDVSARISLRALAQRTPASYRAGKSPRSSERPYCGCESAQPHHRPRWQIAVHVGASSSSTLPARAAGPLEMP